MPGLYALKKTFIVRTSREVQKIRRSGRRFVCGRFLIYRVQNELPHGRFVVAIRRSAGNSVLRNYAKRTVREFFRTHQSKVGCFDYLFFAEKKLQSLNRAGWSDQVQQFKKMCCA